MRPAGVGGAGAAGFTLLEAIVALVVFSMGALALYGWLGTNIDALLTVHERQAALARGDSALEVVRRINPMETPSGRRDYDGLAIEWTSTPIEGPRPAVTQIGLPTIFQVGLYSLDVRVRSGGREVERFRVRQVGYRQVGALEE